MKRTLIQIYQELVNDPEVVKKAKELYRDGGITKDELRRLLEEGKISSNEYMGIIFGTLS